MSALAALLIHSHHEITQYIEKCPRTNSICCLDHFRSLISLLLPARASEQGNVIGFGVRIVVIKKKIVIERTRDLIYLKFVATDFFPKIISPSAGENSVLLMNPLPDHSNYSPL